ncbi:Aspartyl/Asparaginyl beta-hydroxylase [uncultured virus]|nr:Aspartyl/Asparaginyl beta-hydroxylase [uncultured virus]
MDVVYRVVTIIIAFMIFSMVLIVWLWYRNPYYLVTWWNRRIKNECDSQDAFPLNGIPSYHDAWTCSNRTAVELHRLINVNHNDILAEVSETMKHYDGVPMNEIDWVQRKWLKNENRWRPIWVRFMNEWAGSADRLPTLKRIVSLFPDVSTLHVSIFYPGTTLIEHRGPSRAVQRYHYGLKIPEGDVGLKIAGYDVKWKEHEGFVWDDTIPHSAWNHTDQPRIVIFADIFRELSPINSVGSRVIHSLLQRTKHVTQIKARLQHEGVVID